MLRECDEFGGDSQRRQYEVDEASIDGRARHGIEPCGGGILRERDARFGFDRLETERAVAAGARQDDAERERSAVFGERTQEVVDRKPLVIRLPIRDASAANERTPFESSSLLPTPIRILVIEDDASLREGMAAFLRNESIDVVSAATAAEGWKCVERERPDAILCDLARPDEDGLSFIRRLRQSEKGLATVPIPAAAITATAMPSRSAAALAAGFQQCLVKPIDTNVLLETIVRLAREAAC